MQRRIKKIKKEEDKEEVGKEESEERVVKEKKRGSCFPSAEFSREVLR